MPLDPLPDKPGLPHDEAEFEAVLTRSMKEVLGMLWANLSATEDTAEVARQARLMGQFQDSFRQMLGEVRHDAPQQKKALMPMMPGGVPPALQDLMNSVLPVLQAQVSAQVAREERLSGKKLPVDRELLGLDVNPEDVVDADETDDEADEAALTIDLSVPTGEEA